MKKEEIEKFVEEIKTCTKRYQNIFYDISVHWRLKEIWMQGDYENVIKMFPELKYSHETNTDEYYEEYLKVGDFDCRITGVKQIENKGEINE